ncbi:polysaccharide deacetylase family protein [[Clostridium] innocuum]|nr:polysaccharide deacetylase family protein [[Clostridium] innocuum]
MNTKRKKLRKDRLGILVGICVVLIATAGFGLWKISGMLFTDPYEEYKAYNTSGKEYGDIQQVSEEYENEAFVSFTYPAFKEKGLNAVVKAYEKKAVQSAGKKAKQITSIDYDSAQLFDHYVTIAFHERVFAEDGTPKDTRTTWILYDKRIDKQLTLEDVLRRDYPVLVKKLAEKQGWKKEIKQDFSALSMTKNEIQLHPDQKHTISIPFAEYKKYIRLKDKHIPSLYQGDVQKVKAQPKVDPNRKMIAFTFDDGPSAYTSQVMDLFEQYEGRATFFMLGQNVEANKETVKDMHRRGFELGNHSWDHSMDLAASKHGYMSVSEAAENVYKTQDALYAICGDEPQYFRPPYGAVNKNLLKANYLGYAFWDIDTRDWSSKNAASITSAALSGAKNDNIVILFHDIYEPSVESLKTILPRLKEQGYQFVTYSTLMQYEKDYLLKLDAGYGVPKEYANGH